ISSTERLLELIRTDRDVDVEVSRKPSRKPGRSLKSLVRSSFSVGRNVTVGVDIGYDDLKLVKLKRVSNQNHELLEYARIPFDPEIPRESPDFHRFLRPTLLEFCGSNKNADMWCTISSARVETRQFRIPKVAARQVPNAVYWTYQRESAFDEEEKLFDFEILNEVPDEQPPKMDVLAYTVPRDEVVALRDIFAKAGFPLSGISIVPFAFQTLMRTRRVEALDAYVASLYIGRDWSRIDIFHEGNLTLSRGIKAGVRTMMEALQKEIEGTRKGLSLVISPDEEVGRIRAVKKKLKLDLKAAQEYFFGQFQTPGTEDAHKQKLNIDEEKVFKMIQPALERLVRQLERTIRHYALNFEKAKIGKIYISSGATPHPRILNYIGEELGMPTEVLNPFQSSSNFLPLVPIPDSVSEQSSFAPAMGMGLADNSRTPNFLYTHKDKRKAERNQLINRGVFALFALLMIACVGFSFWQEQLIREKEAQKQQMSQHLEQYNLRVDQNLILKLVEQIRQKNQSDSAIGQKYLNLAVISEVVDLTPPNVRLLSISTQLGPLQKKAPPQDDKKKKTAAPPPPKFLVLEGIVQGDRLTLESTLAGYLMELKNSPLFDQPDISTKSFEFSGNNQVLRFKAQLNLV
ncbi:MAG: pilus assembly protein PilM, partial [Desulfobacterales bacterium]|nr:pilus assembly protein PilM [Desulfobacterales bacterium]